MYTEITDSKLHSEISPIKKIADKMWLSIKENFLFATLSFIFIIGYILIFPRFFGAENSIVAIIMTILMGICALRDVSAAPVKNFLVQTAVFLIMTVAACFSVALGTWIAVPINLFVCFGILYAYTYEYSHHLYFPYILSYLFLLFISPVSPSELPNRMLAVVVSSAFMILYALALGYRNVKKPARKSMCEMFNEASSCATLLKENSPLSDNAQKVRELMHNISEEADKLRKGMFELPESAFDLIDVGRGMENLILFLHDDAWQNNSYPDELWDCVWQTMQSFAQYVNKKITDLPEITEEIFNVDEYTKHLYLLLNYVREKLPEQKGAKRKRKRSGIAQSSAARLKNALGYSPVRLVYAIRVAVLLTVFIIPVQYLALPHGKWLLYTLASVSLPYAEDVKPKAKKRLAATVIGGTIVTIFFSLIPDPAIRTVLMMLSGYLSFYFPGYTGNYSCATIGALGGAVMSLTGWTDISTMFGIRLAYIAVGVIIAYVFNALFCPYHRKKASEYIFKKYDVTSRMLVNVSLSETNPQIYYGLVIENNMLESKLCDNAKKAGFKNMSKVTDGYRKRIIKAHRERNCVKGDNTTFGSDVQL